MKSDFLSAILDQILEIARELGKAQPQHIEACSGRLNKMQQEACWTDEALSELFRKGGVDLGATSFLQERQELMRRVLEQNRLISDKVHGTMSVVSNEISQVKKGMTAMSGYKGQPETKGKILGHTC
jgi:hypothetical protein